MWDALAGMLPYSIGLLVSPLPVAAVIMLLVSAGGMKKAAVFEVTWLAVSLLFVLVIAAIVGDAKTVPHNAPTPLWEAVLAIVLGVVMLAMALLVLKAWQRQRRASSAAPPIPRWMHALDDLSTAKTAGLAAVLILANPVNASMLAAAGIALGRAPVAGDPELLAAVLFVLIGSLTMLTPWIVTLLTGRHTGFLPTARHWLLLHNNALTFWMTLAFGLVFLFKGLGALI